MKIVDTTNIAGVPKEYIDFGVNIQSLASLLLYHSNTILKPYKLTFQQYNVLRILVYSDTETVNINYISNQMLDKNSNGSRLVDKLVSKNWAIKRESLSDKRTVNVFITKEGRKLLKTVNDVLLEEYIERISLVITPKEAQIVNSILDKFFT
jgi:DNA-binding MarR family transcriptional regulator